MAVRNFYVEADIDGRKTTLGGGPKAKDGGMRVKLYQRDKGSITQALEIECAEWNGKLILKVFDKDHNLLLHEETER